MRTVLVQTRPVGVGQRFWGVPAPKEVWTRNPNNPSTQPVINPHQVGFYPHTGPNGVPLPAPAKPLPQRNPHRQGVGQATPAPPIGIAGGSLAAIQASIASIGGTVPSTTTMTCTNFAQIATPGGASGGSGAMGWSAPANQPITPGIPTSSALWQQGPTAATFQQFVEQYAQLGPSAPIIHFTVGPNLFKLRVYQGIPQLEVCTGPWTGAAAPAASTTNWLLYGAIGVVVVGGLVYAAG